VRCLYPAFTWYKPTDQKVIYLTFDDGPIPDVTEWVIETLKSFHAKGTFFCVGDNIRKHPQVFAQIKAEGHATGNHTFNHLNGWKTQTGQYLENIATCQQFLNEKPSLFRPPYGRVSRKQAAALQPDYQIIMWDVLSGDFDRKLSPELCLRNTIKHTENGSIVVFHDSLKAETNLRYVLPHYLAHFSSLGYRFEKL
jgi:peptidoglycan/xylan/chitin deacetylase (PgdA/CDA1 family)